MRALLLTALLITAPAAAQRGGYEAFAPSQQTLEGRFTPAYGQCVERSGGVTSDMRECASAEWRRLDTRLNQAFQRALTRLAPARKARLRAEQRRWLAGRNAFCERFVSENGEGGGSMDLLIGDECSLREIVRRTMWLERYR